MKKPTALPVHHAFLIAHFFDVHGTTNDGKSPNATIYGGYGHTTTNIPLSFRTSIKSLRIQLREKSPTFGKLPYY